jgi:ETC complex I subunit conserved region
MPAAECKDWMMSLVKPVARIFVPPKSAMQSGRATSEKWRLSFPPSDRLRVDPLMGWTGSGDTQKQLGLYFATKEAAIAYAEANGIPYVVEEQPPAKPIKPKVYADNFKFGRSENWTH